MIAISLFGVSLWDIAWVVIAFVLASLWVHASKMSDKLITPIAIVVCVLGYIVVYVFNIIWAWVPILIVLFILYLVAKKAATSKADE
ncbi:MAG: hypothetical protein ACYTBZ_07385 [Planctomycetota bacterium]|jgi:hypothetical protein